MPTQLTIRGLDAALLDALRVAAALKRQSVEAFCRDAITAHVVRVAKSPKGASLAAMLDEPKPKPAGH